MPDNENSDISKLIYDLEKINQVIDLCIDRELYEYVDQILKPSDKAQKCLANFRDARGDKSIEEQGHYELETPIKKISIPITIIPQDIISQLFPSIKLPFYFTDNQNSLLRHWSNLFWAKRGRAELQKYNNSNLLGRYEDLTLFLESRMPIPSDEHPHHKKRVFILTKFNYLMELSAVAHREASFGYAERARILLNELYSLEPERGLYDRWIWWNMGTAYQHVGRSQKAILEFNQVIKDFWWQKPEENPNKIEEILFKKKSKRYVETVLEFLVNIVPATMQRAAINLQLQLGYHALQTLNGTDQFLTKIHEDNRKNFFARAAKHLQHRIYLHRIEALLQLELLEEAEAPLNKAYKDIFKSDWKPKKVSLPSQHKYNPPKAVETQLVEHTVTWFYQNAERLITYICNLKNKLEQPDKISDSDVIWEEIKQGFSYLEGLIKIFPEYWKWVKDNREDERIFYSRWAQILKLGMEAMDELPKLKEKLFELNLLSLFNPEDACAQLLEVTINLYLLLSNLEKLPVIRENRPKPNEGITIELENLRSDDLPDFVGGLSSFYEKISQNLLSKKIDNFIKEIIEKTFGKSVEDSVKMLKRDHFRLLAALDEYHELFGENQQIHSLKRCNERLIWCGDNPVSVKNCYNCLKIKIDPNSSTPDDFDSPIAENFDGLLECQKKMPRDQEQLPYEERNRFDLLCYDYESIMQETEDHLTKHLERHSLHRPTKEALHFVGLQRWNSLTPAQGRSVGGGYFIYRTNSEGEVNLGIAIDPGFDYVRNLFRMGFSLMDVDIVLISHAHADHLWDFESMVQLLNDLKVKKGITHRLNVVLTLGSYQRLEHIIKNPKLRRFINPLVIDIRKEIEPGFFNKLGTDTDSERFNYCFAFDDAKNTKKNTKMMRWHPVLPNDKKYNVNSEIEIWPTRAYHDDYSERSDSFGFLINVTKAVTSGSNGKKFCFGYTGDTKWVGNDLYNQACPADDNDCEKKCSVDSPRWEDVASQYTDCDVLLMHLGSLIDHKDNKKQFFSYYSSAKFCEKLIREKNHPYLMGMIRFLRELYNLQPEKKKLILMGEFGEELRGGIRIDLVKRLRQGLTEKWSMLPVDVGLDILLHDYADSRSQKVEKYKFLCALCDKYRFLSEVDYLRFGPDEAIFYTCKTCKKAIPYDVRDTRLRQLYDIGRELEPSHNQTNHA